MMSELFDEQAQREQYEIAHDKEIMEQGIAAGIAEGKTTGILETLVGLVKDGVLSLVDAAKRANLSVSEFEALTGMRKA